MNFFYYGSKFKHNKQKSFFWGGVGVGVGTECGVVGG